MFSVKITIKDIAAEAGVSTSTVSRALNNSNGVNPITKAKILEIAAKNGYMSVKKQTIPSVVIIVPKKPFYFWNETLKGIKDAVDKECISIDIKYYSQIKYEKHNEKDILHCFKNIDKNTKCLIVVPPNIPIVQETLSNISQKIPIYFLNEKLDVKNSVYVGIDGYNEGISFARACKDKYPENPNLLIVTSGNQHVANIRKKGFCDEFKKIFPQSQIVGEIDLTNYPSNSIPAYLARRLSSEFSNRFNVVFVAQGLLPQVCSSLHKLNITDKVICLGCENPKQNKDYIKANLIKGILVQDIHGQGYKCMQLVKEYLKTGIFTPGEEFFIESKILLS